MPCPESPCSWSGVGNYDMPGHIQPDTVFFFKNKALLEHSMLTCLFIVYSCYML